jgi:23S rRNA (adenine2030-N6)-methyltransferase
MLSYQHAYHAGNFADVLKHTVLCLVIDYMKQKDKPFYFHDTHAGRGMYPLSLTEMQKLREHESGIARLWPLFSNKEFGTEKQYASLLPYATALQRYNADGALKKYPGSGLFAHALMRGDDQLFFSELHPAEFNHLLANTEYCHNVHVQKIDAWAGLHAALPPRQKRGVILIDPSYELKNEHQQVINAVSDALKRFETGIYLIWYPIIKDDNLFKKLIRGIEQLSPPSLLRIEMSIPQPETKSGLIGSGMLVINAPWQLDKMMKELLPVLYMALAHDTNEKDSRDNYRVQWMLEKK